ncbi:hypothetical protein LX32DRAFT_680658 [Colletotrichum zoysiae]|uniref:Uncharacterized protein n=1 Tax=Colletotrichum zoysiae TaxID=1216348 RepID=A0AAD9HPV1_9PEZI|nr:hypothetical protein LX32DRAFT_680658 [Colletotrichum zoysiae]
MDPQDGENPEPPITRQLVSSEPLVQEARWPPPGREASPPSWPAFLLRVLVFVLCPWRWLSARRHARRLDKWRTRMQEQWDFDIRCKSGGSRPLPESEEEFLQRVYLLVKAEFAGMTTRVPTWKMYSGLKRRRWSGRTLEDRAARRLVAYMYWALVWKCLWFDFLDTVREYIGSKLLLSRFGPE